MLIVIAALLGVVGFAIGFSAFGALLRARLFRFVFSALLSVVLLVAGHIVKWTALANMLGLHTSYRLDRIAGRYRAIEQETTARRTVYSIGAPAMVDLVALGRRLPLRDFFDAEYGSASYVPVSEPRELDLMVSTTGLLLRPVAPPATPRP